MHYWQSLSILEVSGTRHEKQDLQNGHVQSLILKKKINEWLKFMHDWRSHGILKNLLNKRYNRRTYTSQEWGSKILLNDMTCIILLKNQWHCVKRYTSLLRLGGMKIRKSQLWAPPILLSFNSSYTDTDAQPNPQKGWNWARWMQLSKRRRCISVFLGGLVEYPVAIWWITTGLSCRRRMHLAWKWCALGCHYKQQRCKPWQKIEVYVPVIRACQGAVAKVNLLMVSWQEEKIYFSNIYFNYML